LTYGAKDNDFFSFLIYFLRKSKKLKDCQSMVIFKAFDNRGLKKGESSVLRCYIASLSVQKQQHLFGLSFAQLLASFH